MSLTGWLWGTSQVDEAIDKATSELLPTGTEDIALNLEISDQIRSKAVPPKDAMRALKRRLNHKNPNVQLLALSLTDTCVKNGGDHFLMEVASREFMDNLVSILKIPVLNLDVKNAILRYIQNWAVAFEGKPNLSYVVQVYRALQSEGFTFPPKDISVTSSAMVDTQTAPEWIDSDVCLRCRTPFSFTNRKHHCRNCGQVFDQQCSSKSLPLPHFGIQQEVRVCDSCHMKLTRSKLPKEDRKHSRSFSTPRHRSGRELADEELQRAIQLSLEEVGAANVNGRNRRPGYTPSQPEPSNFGKWQTSEPPLVDRKTRPQAADDDESDPDLRAAIEASLREANAPKPSAPISLETPRSEAPSFVPSQSQSYPATSSTAVPPQSNYELAPLESDVILTFSQTVQEVEARGGRDISRYPAVNELYDKANGLRPKLALSLDDTDRKEKTLSDMHDKLSQAVKLYDKLLTEQLSRPSWRSSSQQESSRYNTVDGSYGQWVSRQPGPATTQRYGEPSYGLPQASQSPPPVNVPYAPVRQSSYGSVSQPAQQYSPTPAPAQYYSSPPPAPTQLPQQPQPAPTTQYATYAQPILPTPVPMASSAQSPPLQPQVSSSAPYTAPTPVPSQPQPQAQYVQSPPPQPQPLSRQNTLSYVPPTPQPVYAQGHAHIPPQAQAQQHQPAQPQIQAQYYQPPALQTQPQPQQPQPPAQAPPQPQAHYQPPLPQAQVQLPQFPVVPTSNPQTFSLYGPTPGLEQTERKEALLIDL
ncbi:ubiquitin binding protein [Fomitiporia mediterranea MF3/22]|uniref:ubiquitin binding protein n=1 Tax=Fomitiporia mediterranea (strain MF3/22) TaxID=694068 RepID=UPI0004407D52|nr:ubiquitin binding protein [Fomitiporia mediterranea MF3/22]EJD04541.1 ubiquitin binding protein [Fomitiporia mediterranea MF3/22]